VSVTGDSLTADTVDRSAAASQRLCEVLALGALKPKELKHLATAVTEAASAEAAHNAAFRERILSAYNELKTAAAPKRTTSSRNGTSKTKTPLAWLTPIHPVDPKQFGPDKLLDPYLIQYAYGDDVLRTILDGYSAARLKEAAAIVAERNPGTGPTNRSRKDALVEYIIQYVLG
jgi:hypothetical protein